MKTYYFGYLDGIDYIVRGVVSDNLSDAQNRYLRFVHGGPEKDIAGDIFHFPDADVDGGVRPYWVGMRGKIPADHEVAKTRKKFWTADPAMNERFSGAERAV